MTKALRICVGLLALLGLVGAAVRDSDGDGMPNGWERKHDLNPNRANSGGDPDRDELSNILEYSFHGHPRKRDTDGDGLRDGAEVMTWYTAVNAKDQAIGTVFGSGACPTGTAEAPCPPLPLFGIPVALEDQEGREISATATHTNGSFAFRAAAGTYMVSPRVPSEHFQAPGSPRFITVSPKQSRPPRTDFSYPATVRRGVAGQATRSPTCPVQRVGEECVAPLEGARIRVDDANGTTVASAVTGPTGLYSFSLEPGSYTLVAEPTNGPFPTPPAPTGFTVTAADSGPHWIPSDYDTGIR